MSTDPNIGYRWGSRELIERVPTERKLTYLARCDCGDVSPVKLAMAKANRSRTCAHCNMPYRPAKFTITSEHAALLQQVYLAFTASGSHTLLDQWRKPSDLI